MLQKTFIALACSILFSVIGSTFAQSQNICQTDNPTSSQCVGVLIMRLYVNDDGMIFVGTSGNEFSLSCTPYGSTTSPTFAYVAIDMSGSNADIIYSTLLAAQLSKIRVGMIRSHIKKRPNAALPRYASITS
jgi:hypothetical protein